MPEGKKVAASIHESKEFRESIFGKDLKYADKKSYRLFDNHMKHF